MLTVADTRQRISIVIPVHFPEDVPARTVEAVLEGAFAGRDLFCEPEHMVAVVDEGSRAHDVLASAAAGSALHGLMLEALPKNLGKAGAVRVGLERLLERGDRPWLVTRDCDGDHVFEDLPRMVWLGEQMVEDAGREAVSVFGARPSWLKPMGWIREEWESLVNRVTVDLVQFLLARQGRVLDRRYWNGYRLDLQAGYRLYSRAAARIAADSLARLPEDPDVYLMACEMLPFPALSLADGLIGQVQVSTRVEQPVSSYAGLPFARLYGSLLNWIARRHDVSPELLLSIVDNHLPDTAAYFSPARTQLLECRALLFPDAPPLKGPRVL